MAYEYDYIGFIVAVLIVIGGAIGYFKAGSVASLIAGLSFGVLLAVGAYFNCRSPPKPLLQFIVLLVLVAFMSYRWYNSSKFMPAGLTTVIAAGALLINGFIYHKDFVNQFS